MLNTKLPASSFLREVWELKIGHLDNAIVNMARIHCGGFRQAYCKFRQEIFAGILLGIFTGASNQDAKILEVFT